MYICVVIDTTTIQKYRGRTLGWLVNKAQVLVNAYVRKRDTVNDEGDFICISCQRLKPKEQMNAGHYYQKELRQYAAVRFDLDNLHSQCVRCNHHLSGNLIPYRANLIKKIGQERFDRLENLANLKGFKHDRITVIDIIERFKKL